MEHTEEAVLNGKVNDSGSRWFQPSPMIPPKKERIFASVRKNFQSGSLQRLYMEDGALPESYHG
jgi:hypothetical protein